MDRKRLLRKASRKIASIDESTAELVSRIGECSFTTIGSPYEVLVKSIIGQQLSTKAAASIEQKFLTKFGRGSFPSPSKLLKIDELSLRGCGLSTAKVQTLQRVAGLYGNKTLNDERLAELDDQAVLKTLCEIKGIGPWTAEMVLMFALDRWDHFSIGDLILRSRVEIWYGIDKNDHTSILQYVEKYSPYRTILSWYLWADHDGPDRGGWS